MNNKKTGQSIIEVMLALGILTAGFLGIATLLVRSFALSRSVSNDLTATYLGAEGIELTKSIIDHDVYAHIAMPPSGGGWASCCAVGTYIVSYGSAALTPDPLPQSNPVYLHFDPATGLYDYTGPVTTQYNRWIQISVPAANELVVNSFVQWNNGTSPQTINLEDHFYNWHP